MFLPDLNNHEKHRNIMIAKKKIINTIIIKMIDVTCLNEQISPIRMVKNIVIGVENLKG
jgi:hypothetical protein